MCRERKPLAAAQYPWEMQRPERRRGQWRGGRKRYLNVLEPKAKALDFVLKVALGAIGPSCTGE